MEPTTTNSAVTPAAVGIRFGILTGLVSIIISFAINASHLEASPLRYITSAVLVAGIILAQREFKKNNLGFIGYGQGVSIGTILSTVVGMLSALFTYVYTTFVDPDMMVRVMDKARTDLEAKGTMTDAQIDQAMAMSAKFTSGPILLVLVIVGSVIIGLIISLITAAIIKNPKPEFE
jgi:hypothetical protein